MEPIDDTIAFSYPLSSFESTNKQSKSDLSDWALEYLLENEICAHHKTIICLYCDTELYINMLARVLANNGGDLIKYFSKC